MGREEGWEGRGVVGGQREGFVPVSRGARGGRGNVVGPAARALSPSCTGSSQALRPLLNVNERAPRKTFPGHLPL